jgi:surface antigen
MGKLLLGLLCIVGSCSLAVVALPALEPPQGMVLPARASGQPLSKVPTGTTGRVVGLSSLRPLFPNVPPGGYPHDTYAWGNCTWWAAYNRVVPPYLGDGAHWLANAAAAGMRTSSEPTVGAIVVYGASPGYDVVHGHVAIVLAVGPTSFRVSEMNFEGLGVVDERDSPWPDWHVEGFVL